MRALPRTRRAAHALLVLGLAACAEEPGDARPLVLVSVPPQQYVVDRIAGDRVRTAVMVPPGANPSTHEPSLARLRQLQEAALYVKVGHPNFPFEKAWLGPLLAEAPELPVVDSAAHLESVESAAADPHLWVAPRHVEQMAIRVEAALEEILPEERAALRENLAAFRAEIDALDAEIRATLAGSEGHRFWVFHPSWGTFARAYGLEQVAIERDAREPDPRALARLIRRARETEVEVIYAQPQFDSAAAETLAAEIGARVETLDPLAYDWAANLRRAAEKLAEGSRP